MDYKSVIEDQIRKLQQVQAKILDGETIGGSAQPAAAKDTAIAIAALCQEASKY